ncbi:F-box protein Met30p [Trichomonascus vanleenenianus]|uniref:F-box/WD repeat-containing protein n=1 Tax=Trichomonascus vanleenenianus TaxID=2268995 RepID=UPI003ECB36D8
MDSLADQDRQAITHVWSLFSAAPQSQRLLMLQGILAQCCSPVLSNVSGMIETLLKVDFISALPPELSIKILCYLDTASLCKAAQVSRKWRELADDDVVWHRMCEQHIDRKCTKCGWGLPLLEKKRLRKSKRLMEQRVADMSSAVPDPAPICDPPTTTTTTTATQATTTERDHDHQGVGGLEGTVEVESVGALEGTREVDSVGSLGKRKRRIEEEGPAAKQSRKTRPWKEVYAERYRVERNWRTGNYKLREFFDPNDANDTYLCLQFDDQYVIAGTCTGKVKVWDVETGELLRVLEGHVRAVNALKFDSTKLVTASSDHTVRIWNYRTGECISTFQSHEDQVLSIDFDGTLIASGGADNNIKVWNFEDKSYFTLRGHHDFVQDVKIHAASRTLYSASEDMTVRMWSLVTKKCLAVFGGGQDGHVAQVQCALPLRLEHLEGGEDYHHERDSELDSDGEPSSTSNNADDKARMPTHILSASLDNTIKLWDVRTGACVRTLFGHVEGVWTIAADTFRIVSGAHDKTVKVWDLQSGKCWHTFTGHTKPVCCVGLNDTRFASAGDDGVVKMYCFDDFDE